MGLNASYCIRNGPLSSREHIAAQNSYCYMRISLRVPYAEAGTSAHLCLGLLLGPGATSAVASTGVRGEPLWRCSAPAGERRPAAQHLVEPGRPLQRLRCGTILINAENFGSRRAHVIGMMAALCNLVYKHTIVSNLRVRMTVEAQVRSYETVPKN